MPLPNLPNLKSTARKGAKTAVAPAPESVPEPVQVLLFLSLPEVLKLLNQPLLYRRSV